MPPQDTTAPPVKIMLSNGMFTVVDAEDAELASRHHWSVTQSASQTGDTFYVTRSEVKDGKATTIYLHRVIMKAEKGVLIDHRDRDGLNNRKSNLRGCTHSQNMANKVQKVGKSGFKGVRWDTHRNGWRAQVYCMGKARYAPGRHKTPDAAARAYDKLAKEIFGEFARPNFTDE